MQRNVHRDRHLLHDLDRLMRETSDANLGAAADAYSKLIGRVGATSSARPMVRLAMEFGTWALLAGEGLSDGEIAKLLRRAVDGVSAGGLS